MADPVGDEFGVIEDGNTYLAGCGPLAEVACDGSRAVGLFWSAALKGPLVWEDGDETAIQSTAGGTKIAWSGDVDGSATDRRRQHFVLTVPSDQFEDEVHRLLELGATGPDGDPTGEAVLCDPDGTKFVVGTP